MDKKRSRLVKKVKKYHIELTALSTFICGVIFFLLLTWVFVLGILVGRGFLPGTVTTITDMRDQIKKLQEMVSHKRSNDLRSPKKSESDPKLAFYENLSSKKDEVKKTRQPEKKGGVLKTEAPERVIEVSKKRPIERKKREGTEILNKQTKSLISDTQYTVQLASLSDVNKAEKMIQQLNDRGYPAYFYEVDLNGKRYYRVRCGRFISKVEARKYAEKLAKETGIKGFVSSFE